MAEELVVRRKSSIISAIIATIMASVLIYLFSHNFVTGKHSIPHWISTIFILYFLTFTLCIIALSVDRKPVLRLDAQGIWRRKNFMPPDLTQLLAWETINYFYIQESTPNGRLMQELMLRLKESDKHIKINLSILDTQAETIMEFIRQKAVEHNFHDLGVEAK